MLKHCKLLNYPTFGEKLMIKSYLEKHKCSKNSFFYGLKKNSLNDKLIML